MKVLKVDGVIQDGGKLPESRRSHMSTVLLNFLQVLDVAPVTWRMHTTHQFTITHDARKRTTHGARTPHPRESMHYLNLEERDFNLCKCWVLSWMQEESVMATTNRIIGNIIL